MSCQQVPVHVNRDVQEDQRCSLLTYFSLEGRKTPRGRETNLLLKQPWSEQSTTQKETLGQTQIPDTKWYLTTRTEAAELQKSETVQTTKRIVRLYTQSGVRRLWVHKTFMAQSSVNAVQGRRTLHPIRTGMQKHHFRKDLHSRDY